MLCGRKGQIIALDFMLSAVIVFAAIGFLMQGHELTALDAKELSSNYLFSSLAETVSEKLLLSDLDVCNVVDQSGDAIPGFKALHCINSSSFANVSKSQLGISANFHCNISLGSYAGGVFTSNTVLSACNEIIPGNSQTKNSIIRKTLVSGTDVSKADLENCIGGNACNLPTGFLRVVVWS